MNPALFLKVLLKWAIPYGLAFYSLSDRRKKNTISQDPSRDDIALEELSPLVHLDMNLSSSFDDLTDKTVKKPIKPLWVAMQMAKADQMRGFYVDLLGMHEVEAPPYALAAKGLWLSNGFRVAYFGPEPAFSHLRENPPRFRAPQLDDCYAALTAAGHSAQFDDTLTYARRMTVIDPSGNEVAFVGA